MLRDYHEKAKKACIDYSFHLIINDPSDPVVEELPSLIGRPPISEALHDLPEESRR